jgi:hypothetical protein
MELTSDQFTHLKKFIQEWLKVKEFELEVTFGQRGIVDSNTFLSIAQRLRSKDIKMIPQEDYLNIITPNQLRVTLHGLGVVQSYCKDDSLTNKEYNVIIKDKALTDGNLDIPEYNLRFKMRREEELGNDDPRVKDMVTNWTKQPKAFRLIRRWSFEYKSVRIDLSMIRQTPYQQGKSGEFDWSQRFLQRNILQEPPRYEVEVELLHSDENATSELAIKSLIRCVGEVQRAIQKNTLLIRNSVIQSVREEYRGVIGTDKFRGVGPVTLQVKNITPEVDERIPNIRQGYNVTDKADGLRAMGFVNKQGELYLLDQSMNVYRTGLRNDKCANSLVDGEWVTKSKDDVGINHFLIFDIYYMVKSERVSTLPFVKYTDTLQLDTKAESRYNKLNQWFLLWKSGEEEIAKGITVSNRLIIAVKTFKFGTKSTNIFGACADILDSARIYNTDGLIITSNTEPIPDREGVRFEYQFKWKPAKDNTVDFLINFERDPESPTDDKINTAIHPSNETTVRYKTARLYVGGSKSSADDNPRHAILMEETIMKEQDRNVAYKPILFNPVDFPDTMANICNIPIEMNQQTFEEYVSTEDTQEPISERSIVEMRYDPSREPGWRWIPSRIRHDKTERLLRAISKGGVIKYSGTMNDTGVANSVWNSIHDPVTDSMIRTGSENPTELEMSALLSTRVSDISKKYYERKASKEDIGFVKGLLDFHNKYIKNEILLKSVLKGGNKTLIDLACGKAGDLFKWHYNNAVCVLGVDTAGENITNSADGAYKRYVQLIRDIGRNRVPQIAFAIGNSSKSIVDGSAGANPEERDILRTIFGRVAAEGPVPPYIEHVMANKFLQGGDIAACMFALHYFFEKKETLAGFMKNLADTVKYGGYFVGCCFDGDTVFDMLRSTEKGNFMNGMEGDIPIWSITKEYDAEELVADESSVGLPINVEFISIGTAHKEYLVSFDFLKKKLGDMGFRLLNAAELKAIGLKQSTSMFRESYKMASEAGSKNKFNMPSKAVKDFSFLNRWFIFKRFDDISTAPSIVPSTIPSTAPANNWQNKTESELSKASKVYDITEEQSDSLSTIQASSKKEMHFDTDITKEYPEYAKYTIVPSSSYSVLKPWQAPQVQKILKDWFPGALKLIIDGTAHIGVDSIHLSNVFPMATVHSYEIVPDTFMALSKNIEAFGKQKKIIPYPDDITLWEPTTMVDLLYVDPPWGGEDYAKQPSINLYLQAEGEAPNEEKNVVSLITKWIDSKRIRNIIIKVPKNFNKKPLQNLYSIVEKTVNNRANRLAYTMILIRSQIPKVSASSASSSVVQKEEKQEIDEKQEIEEKQEKQEKQESKEAIIEVKSRFSDNELFRIGNDARIADILGTGDIYAGRWLALSAPFPIPDADDNTIQYPSIEHYLAGMKLKKAAKVQKDAALSTHYSVKGGLHQKYLKILQTVKPETPKYYEIISIESSEVIKDVSAKFSPLKWAPIQTQQMEYAIQYRLDHDERFKSIVNKISELKRYILYTSKEIGLGGTLDASMLVIKGDNKVGKMIMKLSGLPGFKEFGN